MTRCSIDHRMTTVWFIYAMMAGFILLLLSACSSTPKLPPQAPPAVEVKVPVPVPCETVAVPTPDYPAKQARPGMGIYDLSKIALADRRVRMAETERLRAAATNPCPAPKETK